MSDSEENVQHDVGAPHDAQVRTAVAQQAAASPLLVESIWARIRRHKVVEWTVAYVAFAYALLNGVQMLREAFDWPPVVSRLTAVGLVLGTPVAITLAWFHGHRARHRISGQELSILIGLLVVAGSALWWVSRHSPERATAPTRVENAAATASPAASFNPPPHSVAVLPFVNMSGDKEQEYFSEGLTEELLNSLAEINELQVAGRTSSFYFKGKDADLGTIARKLNVGAVLEGSVRRSGNTVRITTQLINAVTGFHLWSHTYDRDLGDILKLQTELAESVAAALKVTMLGNVAAKLEVGGTRNPAAFDAYLRATQLYRNAHDGEDEQSAIKAYSEAIHLDRNYAIALAARSIALADFAWQYASGTAVADLTAKSRSDANEAIALAPDLADGHLALAIALEEGALDWQLAGKEYERALALAPGNARVLMNGGNYAAFMGRIEEGINTLKRAVVIDPLDANSRGWLGYHLFLAHRYSEAIAAFQQAIAINPRDPNAPGSLGIVSYARGDFQSARSACEPSVDTDNARVCLAITYDKLGQHNDAQNMLLKMTSRGDAAAYQVAEIYAQWGKKTEAYDRLSAAMHLRSPWMEFLKTDPLLDPLRNEARFQAIEKALNFPN